MNTKEVYETHFDELLRYAESCVGSGAEDLVHNAFVRLLTFPDQIHKPAGFLRRVLKGLIIDYQRANGRHRRLLKDLGPQEPSLPVDTLSQMEQAGKIKHIISTMSPVVGDVLLEGLSYQEAAKKYGLAESTIRKMVSDARSSIRAKLAA